MGERIIMEVIALDPRFVYIADADLVSEEDMHRLAHAKPGDVVRMRHPEAISVAVRPSFVGLDGLRPMGCDETGE